jgi:hypothetical protein
MTRYVQLKGHHDEYPVADIEAAVHKAIHEFDGRGLILGADCTLPTGTPLAQIRAAVEATGTLPAGIPL